MNADPTVRFPRGFDPRPILGPLNTPAAGAEGNPAWRRHVTRTCPVRFALLYLPHLIRSPETRNRISLNPLHLAMAESAKAWTVPGRHRDAWIAPRGSGKTSWAYGVLPLWALAHQHRAFFLAFSNNSAQAQGHLANLRIELDGNDLLLRDFPHLRPSRGRGSSDSTSDVHRGPVSFAARGIDSQSLGIRRGNIRPDYLCGDDLEPDESNYSPAAKVKRLATLVNAVFAMNTEAAVSLTGYVTMHGSIMHDLVRHALGEKTERWIVEQGFDRATHHFPAIVERPDGSRGSLWPQRWPLSFLESIEGTRDFALNYANNPAADTDGSTYWTESLFRHDDQIPVTDPVMCIDPAVSAKAGSDYTAVTVAGLGPGGRTVVVGYCRGFKASPSERRRKIHDLIGRYRVRRVFCEVNQGGDLWAEHLSPLPGGVELTTYTVRAPKHVRIGDLCDLYERGRVVHVRPLRELEDQQRAYPSAAAHDDLPDSLAGAVAHLLPKGQVRL